MYAIADGGAAYGKVCSLHPDVVLLDVNLGKYDGRTICQKIKSHNETHDIPVILFSANHNIRESAIESHADDYIEKPFAIDDMLAKVVRVLKAA